MLARYTRPSVLIIEDEQYDRELAGAAFTGVSAELVFAKNAKEAFQAIKDREFSLIMVDLKLPDVVDPVEFVSKVKEAASSAPIVILTGALNPGLESVFEQHAVAVLKKPLTREIVRDAFKSFVQ